MFGPVRITICGRRVERRSLGVNGGRRRPRARDGGRRRSRGRGRRPPRGRTWPRSWATSASAASDVEGAPARAAVAQQAARPAPPTAPRTWSNSSNSSRPTALLGARARGLVLLQLGGDVALGAGQRLAAHVVGRDPGGLGVAHLDAVAEHAVEPDAQGRRCRCARARAPRARRSTPWPRARRSRSARSSALQLARIRPPSWSVSGGSSSSASSRSRAQVRRAARCPRRGSPRASAAPTGVRAPRAAAGSAAQEAAQARSGRGRGRRRGRRGWPAARGRRRPRQARAAPPRAAGASTRAATASWRRADGGRVEQRAQHPLAEQAGAHRRGRRVERRQTASRGPAGPARSRTARAWPPRSRRASCASPVVEPLQAGEVAEPSPWVSRRYARAAPRRPGGRPSARRRRRRRASPRGSARQSVVAGAPRLRTTRRPRA